MEILRRVGNALGGRSIPDGMEERIPSGQYVTPKMVVMTMGATPRISLEEWRLGLYGRVEETQELTWDQLMGLAQTMVTADFHCVTQWTRLNVGWQGVPVSAVLDLVTPQPDARFMMVHCYDGYSTNVDIDALRAPDALFAHGEGGEPLRREHGGPLRLVVPSRYGWKSAKWVCGIEFLADNRPGFWEARGYHMRGDPWAEERFWGG